MPGLGQGVIHRFGSGAKAALKGLVGSTYIADTELHAPPGGYIFCKFRVITAATMFTTGVAEENTRFCDLSGEVLPANTEIVGLYDVLQLASGSILAYWIRWRLATTSFPEDKT